MAYYISKVYEFQPALPMRGVTGQTLGNSFWIGFQPALPMRGVTRMEQRLAFDGEISTRTPHAGSDQAPPSPRADKTDFNPHSPCGE